MVGGKHAGQSHRVYCMSGDAGALPVCEMNKLMTPDHHFYATFQVCSSGYGQAGIGRSSGEGLSTGCYKKAPVRCPCSRLAAPHGASWTHS